MDELKPCPFCGGKARTFEFSWHASQFGGHMFEKPYWQVICESCKAAIGDFDSKAEAIEAWNTRAADAENAKLRELVDELYPLADCGVSDVSELDKAHELMRELGIEVDG